MTASKEVPMKIDVFMKQLYLLRKRVYSENLIRLCQKFNIFRRFAFEML